MTWPVAASHHTGGLACLSLFTSTTLSRFFTMVPADCTTLPMAQKRSYSALPEACGCQSTSPSWRVRETCITGSSAGEEYGTGN